MPTPPLDRRSFLAGLVAAAAVGVAACAEPRSSEPARTAEPTAGRSAVPSASGRTSPAPPSPAAPSAAVADRRAIEAKAARMVMVGFRGLTIHDDDPIANALAAGLGGVILFDRDQTTGKARNIASPEQVARLTASVRARASHPVLIAIDQEGGKVARLGPQDGFPATKSEASVGRADDPTAARAFGRGIGATLRAAGIDLDLAPVVDVDIDPKNPAIGALDRSFSADPDVVGAMAAAEIRGLHDRGTRSALKHFPGLGSASANTDFDRVDVTKTWTRAELRPYETLFGLGLADVVMVGHIVNGRIDEGRPASLSRATVDGLLRGELGWTGPVMTDDLGAVAITSTVSQRDAIALAIDAGVDLLLFANQATFHPDIAAEVVGTIADLVEAGRIETARLDASIARLVPMTSPPD